jgi:hypothetical protein
MGDSDAADPAGPLPVASLGGRPSLRALVPRPADEARNRGVAGSPTPSAASMAGGTGPWPSVRATTKLGDGDLDLLEPGGWRARVSVLHQLARRSSPRGACGGGLLVGGGLRSSLAERRWRPDETHRAAALPLLPHRPPLLHLCARRRRPWSFLDAGMKPQWREALSLSLSLPHSDPAPAKRPSSPRRRTGVGGGERPYLPPHLLAAADLFSLHQQRWPSRLPSLASRGEPEAAAAPAPAPSGGAGSPPLLLCLAAESNLATAKLG